MRYFIPPLALVVFACTPSLQQAGLTACEAYNTSLSALAGYRQAGKLSDEQITTVNTWRPILNEACSEPVTRETLDAIERGLFALITIEEAVQ